jgi:PAS domain S-box-containing protein
MSRRVNKKRRAKRDGQNRDGAVRRNRKSIRAATKMTNGTPGTVRKNGAPVRSRRVPAFRNPKTELEAAIQRFVDLYDFAPIAYVSFDRAGRIEEANLVATELLGDPRDRLIGRPFAFYVGDLDLFLRHLLYCRTSQQQVETELELKPRKGERIPALLCSRPITSTTRNGALLYQTAIMDLSERKRAEQALRESSQRLQATYERAPIGIIECSPEGKYVGANEEFCRILGYRKEELLQCGIKDVTPKEDYSREIKLHRQLVAGEIPFYELEKRFVRKDGVIIWAQILRSLVRDAEGTPLYTIGAARDITERKAAEEKLTWLAAYPRDNPDPVVEFDLETNAIYYANPSAFESFPDLQRLQLRHPFLARMVQAARPLLEGRTKSVNAEISVGKSCYVATAVRIPKTKRLRVYSSDISERKRAESALEQSKRLLEARVREGTRELRVANTELRNEIERRKGLEGEILAVSDREQQRLGQELHDGVCQHLTAVAFMARSVALRLKNHRVIDATDIEKIAQLVNDAAGDMRNLSRALHRSDVDAPRLTGALQDLVDREIWRVSCRLEVKPSFQIEDDAVAAQLYRIAREAVINANKHSQAREIVVRLERSRGGMVLHVTDDGVGFSNGTELRQGLGFHIMNYRAQVMGGRLEIESPKRGGTRVSCYLPNKALQSRKKENAGSGLPGKIANALAALI